MIGKGSSLHNHLFFGKAYKEERLFIEEIGKDLTLLYLFLKRRKMVKSLLFYKGGEENLSLEQSLFHVVSGSGMDFVSSFVADDRSLA